MGSHVLRVQRMSVQNCFYGGRPSMPVEECLILPGDDVGGSPRHPSVVRPPRFVGVDALAILHASASVALPGCGAA